MESTSNLRHHRDGFMTVAFRIHSVPRLELVSAREWDELAGSNFYATHGWLSSVEAERTARAEYILVERGGLLVGASPVYSVLYESYNFYSPQRYQALFGCSGRPLFAGVVRGYRNTFLVSHALTEEDQRTVVRRLVESVVAFAAERRQPVVMPYLTGSALVALLTVETPAVALDNIEAMIEIGQDGLEGYVRRLPSKWRMRLRREMRVFSAAGWRIAEESLATSTREVARLVANVQRKYGHAVDDRAIARILGMQAAAVGDRAVLLTCRDASERLTALSLAYAWESELYARTVGFEYGLLRSAYEYFNLALYGRIDYMSRHSLSSLHLGIGALEAKVTRGASLHPLWAALLPRSAARPESQRVAADRALELLRGVSPSEAALQTSEWSFVRDGSQKS